MLTSINCGYFRDQRQSFKSVYCLRIRVFENLSYLFSDYHMENK